MAEKRGLVLGGGGSRGSYEIGVIRALNEKGLSFDVVTGTSIGSIVGCVYVQDPKVNLTDWLGGFTSEDVDTDLFVFPSQYEVKSLYGSPALTFFEMFSKNGPDFGPLANALKPILDYDKFQASKMEYGCIAYNVTKQKGQVFTKRDFTGENMVDIVLASSAYFPAFNFEKLNGDIFVDGGYCDTIPSNVARDMGAKSLVIVDLSDDDVPVPELEPGDVFMRPIRHLSYFLDFDGATLQRQAVQGYLDGLKFLDMAPGYLYTFYEEDWDYIQRLEKGAMALLVRGDMVSLVQQLPEAMKEIYEFLLGYVPRPLNNQYSSRFLLGRLMECMGIIAGVDLDVRWHYRDFLSAILKGFNDFTGGVKLSDACRLKSEMEMKGLRDMLVFFHSALISYGDVLPEQFEIFKKKYLLPYYLAQGWRLMERLRLVLGI